MEADFCYLRHSPNDFGSRENSSMRGSFINSTIIYISSMHQPYGLKLIKTQVPLPQRFNVWERQVTGVCMMGVIDLFTEVSPNLLSAPTACLIKLI